MTEPPHVFAAVHAGARQGRRQVLLAIGAWALIVIAVALAALEIRLRFYREQVSATASARLAAAQDTLSLSMQQWAAIASELAQRRRVVDYATRRSEAAEPDADEQRSALAELVGVGERFRLPLVALVSPQGRILTGTGDLSDPATSARIDVSDRLYVRDALATGRGTQFVLGRVSGQPGLYFAERIERDGRPLGVAVVKQDAEVVNRLLSDAQRQILLVTDPNGVVVLANLDDILLRRLDTGTPLSEAAAQPLYRRVPEPLEWAREALATWAQPVEAVRIDTLRHVVRQAPLEGTPLTAWVLSPLTDETAIRTRFAIGLGALWAMGSALIWFSWRRLRWLQQALDAQRDAAQLAQARRMSDDRFTAVYEHAANAYLFFTARGGIDQCNPAALRLFGAASESELLGLTPWQPPLSPERQRDGRPSLDAARLALREHLETRQRVNSGEWRFRRLDGREFDAEFAVIALEFEQPARFCAVVQDVTARRETEVALLAAKSAAEDASRAKSAFLANMSHELRTPMNAILGMTHLALGEAMPARSRGYVEKAHHAARSLLSLVDDVLDMSKIEAGQLQLERVDFDVEAVIAEMADVLGLRAEEKALELVFRAAPELPRRLVGDPTRLRQILVNLGGNAIKFTERGEVTVGLEVAAQNGDTVEIHGWVRDTGVGLSEAERERIFQPFVQADVSTTRRFGGSGLGLAICRQLVERMDGRLWVDSTPGQGSTFHFTARFGRSRFEGAAAHLPALRGRRALLVDDNAAAREALGTMLESFGVAVESLDSGEQAVEVVERQPPGTYAWILLDWKMPGMDGVACARRLLLHGPAGQRPCILLVTAFAREEALAAARGLPLAGVLQKPVTPSALHDRLLETAPAPAAAAEAPRPPPPPQRPSAAPLLARAGVVGLRVLVVEDNALNQELARELLERAGARVTIAEHGAEALARVREGGEFDIVLMDCQMPVMDGYEATRRLRELPASATLPILAMTASALAEDRERAFASGMDGHLTKPLDVERLLDAIATHARRPDRPQDAPVDTDAGLARCLGQQELYRRMLRGFQQTQSGFIAGYRRAIQDGRPADAARALHDLTGLAGTIGAVPLQRAAQQLRAAPEAQRAAAFETLQRELERVLTRLRELLEVS